MVPQEKFLELSKAMFIIGGLTIIGGIVLIPFEAVGLGVVLILGGIGWVADGVLTAVFGRAFVLSLAVFLEVAASSLDRAGNIA
jgi:hypothetical protein